jgi:hypothetical protein
MGKAELRAQSAQGLTLHVTDSNMAKLSQSTKDQSTQTKIETKDASTLAFPQVQQSGVQTEVESYERAAQSSASHQASQSPKQEAGRGRDAQPSGAQQSDPLGGWAWAAGHRFNAAQWERAHAHQRDRRYYYVLELPEAADPYRLCGVHAALGSAACDGILKENKDAFHKAVFKNESSLGVAYSEYLRRQVHYKGAPSTIAFHSW